MFSIFFEKISFYVVLIFFLAKFILVHTSQLNFIVSSLEKMFSIFFEKISFYVVLIFFLAKFILVHTIFKVQLPA